MLFCFLFCFILLFGRPIIKHLPTTVVRSCCFFFSVTTVAYPNCHFYPTPIHCHSLAHLFETVGMGFPGVVEEEPKKSAILQLTVHTIPSNSVPIVVPRSTCTTLLFLPFQSLRPHSGLGTRKQESRAQEKWCGCVWESDTGLWV